MDSICLTIDNQDVNVKIGSTVLDAIQNAGAYVPTLCHSPDLKPYGACRLCIVRIEGIRGFPTACTTPAQEGMKVLTETDELRRIRRNILELVIANHPNDCVTCFKSQECELLKVARYLGAEKETVERLRRNRPRLPLDTSNPAFIFDPNKCILCGKCVRVCREIQGLSAIDFAGRGYHARVSNFGAQPWARSICQTCGECVARCPTGALAPKAIEIPQKETRTLCPFCGVGCSLLVGTRGNRIVRVRGDFDSPVNQGGLCVKGRFGLDFVNHPERLTRPLIRKENVPRQTPAALLSEIFREADWDEALGLVAAQLTRIRDIHSPRSLGVLSSAKCTNEENYVTQKFARAVLKTNNVDHCARLCHASTVVGAIAAFGSGAMSNSIEDIATAETILVIGSNTTECHPIIGRRIKQNVRENRARLVVADPRSTELCELADIHLNHRPGTDVALLNGIMNEILNKGLHNAGFIQERCEDFHVLQGSLKGYDPEAVEAITGVSAEKIRQSARLLGEASGMVVVYGMGITQHTTGTDNVKAVANLLMLTGSIGRKGTGFSPLRGQNNVQGACDMGALPDVFPGYQGVEFPKIREKFRRAWGVDPDPHKGMPLTEMMQAAHAGALKAMFVVGENPMMSEPDLAHVREAFAGLEFLVVEDIFLTETARMADVVLPAACFGEKTGTFTNTERRVQMVRKVLDPPGQARGDWEIIADIANRMGYAMPYASSEEIMREIAKLTPSYGGMTYERLSKPGGLQWPCPDTFHPGTPRLHQDGFPRGKGKFHAIHYTPPAEAASEDYPMILTTGRVLEHFHTGSMSRRSRVLEILAPESHLDISLEDALSLGVEEGDTVSMLSKRGEIRTKAHLDRRIGNGTAFMAFHWNEAPANELTNAALDPVSKIPEYKVSAVKVRRL